jgi:putative intracellular protease/amidase
VQPGHSIRRKITGPVVMVALMLSVASSATAQQASQTAAKPRVVAPPTTTAAAPALRAPAVPLVAYDPYFSIWSPADRLTDAATVHWTGRAQPMTSFIRVDGEPFRLMGPTPADTAALAQRSVTISATRTTYEFGNARVRVTFSFLTRALPNS